MNLQMDVNVAAQYRNPSQISKAITENWMLREGYCPSCNVSLNQARANAKVFDFVCTSCKNQFELKGKKGKQGKRVSDGAYSSMLSRVQEDSAPHFFFLSYDQVYKVSNLIAVPNYFFQPSVIEQRKPLALTAKRAGWIGCNILLDQIPTIGRIKLVEDGEVVDAEQVQKIWQKTTFLGQQSKIESRGWTLDVMKCIEELNTKSFSLDAMYKFEHYLAERHPNNRHIKDKIRQQLQILRDKGLLEFKSRGFYELTKD